MKSSLTLTVLSIMLGIFFIMVGTIKLSIWPSEDLHRDIRRTFIRLARLWPRKISANHYRKCIGIIEILGGSCLMLAPGMLKLKLYTNILLVFTTSTVIANMYWSGEKLERTAQFIVFLFMLICRIIVHFQVRREWNKTQNLEQTNLENKKLKTG